MFRIILSTLLAMAFYTLRERKFIYTVYTHTHTFINHEGRSSSLQRKRKKDRQEDRKTPTDIYDS